MATLSKAIVYIVAVALACAACATSGPASGSGSMGIDRQTSEPGEALDAAEPQDSTEADGAAADPTPPPSPGPPGDPTDSRGSRTVGGSGPAADADPEPDPPEAATAAETLDQARPIAGTIAEFVRAWDDTNRRIFEADPASFERVAAELEQVSAVATDTGRQLFWARLSEGGIVAGTTDDDGNVTVVAAITGIDAERDRIVALTTLALFFNDERALGLGTENYQEVVDGDVGESETVIDGDLVAVIDRRDIGTGSVSIVVANGVDAAALEQSADGLVELILELAKP